VTVPDIWSPTDAGEVAAAVNDALASGQTLELLGGGSRRRLGRPVDADVLLDLSLISGIVSYQAEELVLVVAPATPLAEIRTELEHKNQHLAFEPPAFGPLWGDTSASGTIGGAIMIGRGGARRLTAGGARDHVLGVKGVNGFGEAFAAGGRVVKNVTGFDLSKLVTGSFGTLCAVTELTLKVLPRPADAATLVIFGLDDEAAVVAMRQALNLLPVQVSSAAHLPAAVAPASTIKAIADPGVAATLLRIEGFGPSVTARLANLKSALADVGPCVTLDAKASATVWSEVSDATFFAAGVAPLWRLSVPPARGAVLGARLAQQLECRHYYDLAGGAIWLETSAADDAHALAIRGALQEVVAGDGHATLMRASDDVRRSTPPFQPLTPVVADLTERVRRNFDPRRIFNPGRMYA